MLGAGLQAIGNTPLIKLNTLVPDGAPHQGVVLKTRPLDNTDLKTVCDKLWVVDHGAAVAFDGGYRAWRAAALANFPYEHWQVPGAAAFTAWRRLTRQGAA